AGQGGATSVTVTSLKLHAAARDARVGQGQGARAADASREGEQAAVVARDAAVADQTDRAGEGNVEEGICGGVIDRKSCVGEDDGITDRERGGGGERRASRGKGARAQAAVVAQLQGAAGEDGATAVGV